jgi:hypothetical protein
MGNGSGVSRGDRNRNARLARLRVLVPVTNAIVGIDLADRKQMVVVTDRVGLGRCARCGEGVCWGDSVLRADRAPVAGAGAAGRGAIDAVRVCAAAADVGGAAQ